MPSEPTLAWNKTGLISSPPHSPAIELEMYHITIEVGWMEGWSTSWLANTFAWTTGSDPAWEMYIHNNYNKVKPNIHGSGVSSMCAAGSWWIAKAPCNEPWHRASIFQDYSIVVCVCLRLLCRLVSQLPPAFPLSHCRTKTCRCAVPCVHACLRVPAKLAQHLERISVPLFCSHCLEWAKEGQVQGSTGSRFIFPFISILTLPCNHPHCWLFSMPGSFTRETVGGGKPGAGA